MNPVKPTALKVIQGTFRKDRANDAEAQPDVRIPSCPKWMSKDARAEWRRVSRQLKKLGLVAEIDRAMLAAYCVAWGKLVECQSHLQDCARVEETPNGVFQQAAWQHVENKALDQLFKFAAAFGMSPSARAKVKALRTGEQEQDPWSEL